MKTAAQRANDDRVEYRADQKARDASRDASRLCRGGWTVAHDNGATICLSKDDREITLQRV